MLQQKQNYSKRVVQKTAESTGNSFENKITDKITSVSETKSKEKEDETQIYIPQHCMKSNQIRSYIWSAFTCVWIEYGHLLHKSPYSI